MNTTSTNYIDCSKAENYLREKSRITTNCFHINCEDCPLSHQNNKREIPCYELEEKFPQEAIAIIQEQSDIDIKKTFANIRTTAIEQDV